MKALGGHVPYKVPYGIKPHFLSVHICNTVPCQPKEQRKNKPQNGHDMTCFFINHLYEGSSCQVRVQVPERQLVKVAVQPCRQHPSH